MAVKVRGACKAGHITETEAPKGRVTWNGPCSREGCGLSVYARRVPRDRVAPANNSGEKPDHTSDTPPEQPEQPSHRHDTEYPYVEVKSYGDLPEHGRRDALTVEPEQREPEQREPEQRPGPAGAAADEQPDPVTDDRPRRSLRDRLRDRSARGRHEPYQHPLL